MKSLFVFLFCLFNISIAISQSTAVFNRISTDDAMGLASNQVNSVHQDSRGFLWVGTANGLQRFDGSKFVRFQHRSNSVPIDELHNILEDKKGRLWLSFRGKREFGIFNPSDYSYKSIPIKVKDAMPSLTDFNMWIDQGGDIYLNISKFKVLRYNEKEEAFTEDIPFKLPKGWKPGLRFFEDTVKRHLYMTSFEDELLVYDYNSRQIFSKHHNPLKIAILDKPKFEGLNNFYIDSKRRYWLFNWPSSEGQAKHCLDSNGVILNDTIGITPPGAGYSEYNNIYETHNGNIWVSGLNMLLASDAATGRFEFYKSYAQSSHSIQYSHVNEVMEDRDGIVWVATDKGLFLTKATTDKSVWNILIDESRGKAFINDILQLRNGDYWFANWGRGVIVIDRNFGRKENFAYSTPVPSTWPQKAKNGYKDSWSLHESSKSGLIWIGHNGGILNVYNPVKKSSRWLMPKEFANSTIRTITEDEFGTLWFGTQGGRVIRYDNDQFRVMHDFNTVIGKVFIDKQNVVWVSAFEKGLYAIDRETGKIVQHYHKSDQRNPTFGNTAVDIEQLNDSTIVYGASALNFINKRTGKVHIYSFHDGLPSNTIQRLRMDKQGYLWIMTTSGLCRYNPMNNRITPFGKKDGIVLSDLTRACDYVSDEGFVLFGGENAITLFDPRNLQPEKKVQNVMITDIRLSNDFLPLDSTLKDPEHHFTYIQNSLSFYFSALSYVMNEKLTYYYMLEGADKDWIRAERNNFVSYPQLPPGPYEFKVYCENSEGIRSVAVTSFPFRISPPFYRTPWFVMLMMTFIGAMVYLVHRLRVNKLIAVQQLRLRVARDLHDDMGSTLSTINILSSMAKTKINTDTPKATEFITKISDNSQRMMEAMDDIVWSIKPSNDSMEKITSRMREFSTSVLEARDMDVDFNVEENVYNVKLNMEARRDFFLIFKEAVNNAAKYSKASKVKVLVACRLKKLILTVKDDGVGFEQNRESHGNGLGNMQKRADAMHASLLVDSIPGNGTRVSLSVPLT